MQEELTPASENKNERNQVKCVGERARLRGVATAVWGDEATVAESELEGHAKGKQWWGDKRGDFVLEGFTD